MISPLSTVKENLVEILKRKQFSEDLKLRIGAGPPKNENRFHFFMAQNEVKATNMKETFSWGGFKPMVVMLLALSLPTAHRFALIIPRMGGFAFLFIAGVFVTVFAVPLTSLQVNSENAVAEQLLHENSQ